MKSANLRLQRLPNPSTNPSESLNLLMTSPNSLEIWHTVKTALSKHRQNWKERASKCKHSQLTVGKK